MNYLLLAMSVCANVAYSSFYNYFGKRAVRKQSDNYRVNMMIYSVAAVALIIVGLITGMTISPFTLFFGMLFGAVTALSGIFKLNALNCGPMSFTILLITSSMILPAFSGYIIWGEPLSIWKVIGTLLMIVAAYFSTEKQQNQKKKSAKWLIFCFLAFLFVGSIGIMQKVQQKSDHSGETGAFLAVAFITAALFCAMSYLIKRHSESKHPHEADVLLPIRMKKLVVLATICGIFIAFLNEVNLYLSGALPSAFLFPIQNGGTTMVSVIVAMTLFREKISGRHAIGMAIAITALVMLALSELL